MSDSNPKVTITNNSGVNVEIFDVYNAEGDSNAKYTYTSLGKVKAGETGDIQTIHFASQLQAMYTGAVAALNNNYYYSFPIAVFGVSALSDVTAYTISGDDKTGMEQAFNFTKYISANAESKIAKDFMTAISDKDQKKAVNAFFAGTGNFNKCNLKSWTAVTAWQTQFTSAWQGPYYLYNEPKGDSQVKLIAVVNITSTEKENTAVISMANADGEVTGQSEIASLVMAGDGDMSEQNVGKGNLSVTLQPVWMNVIQAGKDGKLNYLIGSAMTGTVNGIKITGTQQSRKLPDSKTKGMSEKEKQAAQEKRERQFDRLFSKVTTVIGLLASIGMLIVMIKQMKQGHTQKKNDVENNAGENPDKSNVEQQQQEVDNEYEEEIRIELDPRVEDAQSHIDELEAANSELVSVERQSALDNVVDQQVDELTEVLEENPPTDRLEKTAEELLDAKKDIENGDFESAQEKVTNTEENLDSMLEESSHDMQQYEKDALEEAQEAIQEQKEQTEALDNVEAERDAEMELNPEEDLPSDTFDAPETDLPEFGVE